MELPGCERDRYKDLVPKVMGKDENCCAEWARACPTGTKLTEHIKGELYRWLRQQGCA